MKGAIAAGYPMTANAVEEILQDGGNAFDAILAAYFCVSVVDVWRLYAGSE
ncbi:MAG: gamma-glutamyltranspeptidase [Porticoccus sp.]|jgi:gamma-glutamyltranspeptidase